MKFIEFFHKAIILIFTPIYWLISFIFHYNTVKQEILQFLQHQYNQEFNPNDYYVDVSIFSGFYIRNRKTKNIIVNSYKMIPSYLEVKIEDNHSRYFPTHLIPKLSKSFEITERMSIWIVRRKLSLIHHYLEISPNEDNKKRSNIRNPIYTDIIISLDGTYNIISVFKELYDLSDMYGNRISMDEYPANYYLNDFFQAIIIEEMIKNKEIIEILPELVIPSAYDFNSDDFNGRLLISEMFTC